MPGPCPKSNLGVRAIVMYKAVKGALEIALSGALVALLLLGLAGSIQHFAAGLQRHFSRAWSVYLAQMVMRVATRHRVEVTSIALVLDGLLSMVEGWALWRGHWWGPWLVVVASGSLLPFEIYEMVVHARVSRIGLFVLNLVIVVYLAKNALHEARARRAETHGSGTA